MATFTLRGVLANALPIVALALGSTACNKEKPTTVIITVKEEDGTPVSDAYVRLFANPIPPLKPDLTRMLKEGMTGSNGTVEFDYTGLYEQGQAGYAVLDILTYRDTMYAEGIIKVLEEETNEETLFMQEIPD